MKRATRYSAEVRERAGRMVLEHQDDYPSQRAAIVAIAGKLGCGKRSGVRVCALARPARSRPAFAP